VVDGRLDDLFSVDDETTGEKTERLQDEVDGRLDDLFSGDPEETTEESEHLQDVVADQPEDVFPPDAVETEFAEKGPRSKSHPDESKEAPEHPRAAAPDTGTADKTKLAAATRPAGQHKEGAVASPAETKKSTATDSKQNNQKKRRLKLILGGIMIAGGALAFFIFSQSPEPLEQRQPVAAPTTHKIVDVPAKIPDRHTVPPVAAPIPQRVTAPTGQADIPATVEKVPPPAAAPVRSASAEITEFLLKWAAAWEKCAGKEGDMNAYMSFYSDDFSTNGFDKDKWQKDKLEKNRKKEWIRIKLDNIQIVGPLSNGRYAARFTQVYQSSNYADTSKQILIVKPETAGWKIIGIKPQTPGRYPFSIHGGSHRTLAAAQKGVAGYRKKGLEAYWTRVELPEKGTWYRVFIGHYDSLDSARKMIAAQALIDVRPVKTRYANLIGTYSSEDDVQRQRRVLIEKGYSPYVILDDNGDRNLYTGAYASLADAEKDSAELNTRGIPSRVVER
jgi:hypothetical protein